MVHILWAKLQKHFRPVTEEEKYALAQAFANITQGTKTIKEFTNEIQLKSNTLRRLGIEVNKGMIKSVLMAAFTNENLRSYLHTLPSTLSLDECFSKIRSYDKNVTQSIKIGRASCRERVLRLV